MKSKRLIVVSLDALSSIDFDMFSKLPNFKKFIPVSYTHLVIKIKKIFILHFQTV